MSRFSWAPYVPVAERRAKARKEMQKLCKNGKNIQPVEIEGRNIARSFWGKGWCDHLESFSDYSNRLPRGRTYVRNGSVCHLEITAGTIEAFVSGSELYRVGIKIKQLDHVKWKTIKSQCSGQIGSILELLKGKLSDQVMGIVTEQQHGLFPLPKEISLSCSCPDVAVMCKHVAAALYGVGSRLDTDPGLLFLLRGVDPVELISAGVSIVAAKTAAGEDSLDDALLGGIFGIDLDDADKSPAKHGTAGKSKKNKKPDSTIASAVHQNTAATAKKPRAFVATGARIAKLREKSGLSAPDFAQEIGVSAASIYRWETIKGKLNLQSRSLAQLQAMHERFAQMA